MEGVVLQGVVVVVQLRLGEAWVHRGSRSRKQPMDGEGIGGGVLHILGFLQEWLNYIHMFTWEADW